MKSQRSNQRKFEMQKFFVHQELNYWIIIACKSISQIKLYINKINQQCKKVGFMGCFNSANEGSPYKTKPQQPLSQEQKLVKKFCPLDHPITNVKIIQNGFCHLCVQKELAVISHCSSCKYQLCLKCYPVKHQDICEKQNLVFEHFYKYFCKQCNSEASNIRYLQDCQICAQALPCKKCGLSQNQIKQKTKLNEPIKNPCKPCQIEMKPKIQRDFIQKNCCLCKRSIYNYIKCNYCGFLACSQCMNIKKNLICSHEFIFTALLDNNFCCFCSKCQKGSMMTCGKCTLQICYVCYQEHLK